jgi:hypothetical protein
VAIFSLLQKEKARLSKEIKFMVIELETEEINPREESSQPKGTVALKGI